MKTKLYANVNKFYVARGKQPKYKRSAKIGEKWVDAVTVWENEGKFGNFLTIEIDWSILKQMADEKGEDFQMPTLEEPNLIDPDSLPF